MPTAFSHPAVALALRLGAGARAVPVRLVALAAACSVLPDVDAIGYWLGLPYGHYLGHRGLTHSPFFALLLAGVVSRSAARFRASRRSVFVVVALATASHGLLDAATSGGLGIALLSPFSNERFFLPWRPIAVSPISVIGFFQSRSLWVLASELVWVWLPMIAVGAVAGLLRREWVLAAGRRRAPQEPSERQTEPESVRRRNYEEHR